ncbi:F0F1 ATP synthase subunit B [Aeoliella mucimassa]|uniref:ATP synthase subunit b n=1 Tax=Aeoliella mucimassa TaxID=2527972 RepID=A0A518ANR7_9BACT|nr:F0F1 ATP synthase subunit B [Aeoliella mucimassa]QDU56375.1 ATP synthase subunit b [Aeoliella mucimassa]
MSALQPFVRWLMLGCMLVAVTGAASLAIGAEHPSDEAASAASHEATTHGEAPEPVLNPLVFDPDLAIYTAIIFAVLLAVLWKFAWGPITEALDAREKAVADNIAAAEAKHEEAKGLLAAHEARLATAKEEVREMLEEARRDAEATKSQILSEAEAAAKSRHDRAVRDIEQARDSAVRTLAETSANLAVDLAGKVIAQNLSTDQQAELVREATTKLANTSPSNN